MIDRGLEVGTCDRTVKMEVCGTDHQKWSVGYRDKNMGLWNVDLWGRAVHMWAIWLEQ